ncbi:MAG: glycosyltransferase, partial [Candidatus Lokiarchaeota archaeon]|nr:glycosyltransferase [Candidatus Lokiarchaeota archaeon]
YESDNRVRRYAETLAEQGFVVDAIALKNIGQKTKGELNGVNIYRIQKRSYNEKNKYIYLIRIVAFFLKSSFFISFKHLISSYRILHVHSVPDFLVFSTILPKITGSKIILDIHDLVPELFASKFKCDKNALLFKLLLIIEKLSSSFCDHIIIANHIWHKEITNRSVEDIKCTAIMNYPDPKLFQYTRKIKNNEKFITIYPGTLSKHQGIETAIRAIYMLKEKIPNLEFRIFGKGTDKQYFENLINDLNLQSTVYIKGLLPLEDIAKAISEADLGIEPKLSDGFADEAFSTKIFEFMMVGVPVVVSKTKVHRYYLDETIVSFFEPGNIEQLSQNIYSLWQNPEKLDKYAEMGREFIKDNTWDKKKNIYNSIVNNLLKKGVRK